MATKYETIRKYEKKNEPGYFSYIRKLFVVRRDNGQSLVEVVVSVAILILFVVAAIGILALFPRLSRQSATSQAASELGQELIENVTAFTGADWHNVVSLTHSSSTPYHLINSGNFFVAASGSEAITLDSRSYTRSFAVTDVYRDSNGMISATGTLDSSTLAITVTVTGTFQGQTASVNFTKYLTRTLSRVFDQTDWAGGGNQEGPITGVNTRFSTSTNVNYASSGSITIQNLSTNPSSSSNNIDPIDHWAWNDVIGWLDFFATNTVTVSSTKLMGYASSGVGYIALDCGTSPTPNCAYPYYVANDGNGNLSGWAWNDTVGWISFASSSAQSTYSVTVDPVTGIFSGWAWNDTVGWISFNCINTNTCGTSNYKVKTRWGTTVISAELISSIFDTGISGGAAFNTILWQGTKPTGTGVKFQIATSDNSAGPWNYLGPDGSSATYYNPAGPNVQVALSQANHNNRRYVRYKIILESDADKTVSPRVDDIIIGWSP